VLIKAPGFPYTASVCCFAVSYGPQLASSTSGRRRGRPAGAASGVWHDLPGRAVLLLHLARQLQRGGRRGRHSEGAGLRTRFEADAQAVPAATDLLRLPSARASVPQAELQTDRQTATLYDNSAAPLASLAPGQRHDFIIRRGSAFVLGSTGRPLSECLTTLPRAAAGMTSRRWASTRWCARHREACSACAVPPRRGCCPISARCRAPRRCRQEARKALSARTLRHTQALRFKTSSSAALRP